MSPFKRIGIGLAILLIILLLGSLGYRALEGWDFFDSLYMTIITLSTVGYQEVRPLSPTGRLFTMLLILTGLGFMFYVVGMIAQVVLEGQLQDILGRRRLEKKIEKMRGHYIICGFGRIGEVIARELTRNRIPIVVIDSRPQHAQLLDRLGYPYIIGNAIQEEVLLAAGLLRAQGLVATVTSDADNVYIVLTARSLNPNLKIVARAGEAGSDQKLRRAGANVVISPYELGGQRMAQTIIRPTVVDFMDVALGEGIELSLEEVAVGPHSELVGVALKDSGIRQRLDLIIVAIKRQDGTMIFNPQPEAPILAGDTLIALGSKANLDRLAQLLEG